MTAADAPDYLSGDLRICPSRGIVVNAAGASVRLGPVNMRVLMTLAANAEATVGRAEIYESVWGNQVVGEDALTRCVSDIRAELRKLSDRDGWIETLPKRGYRWVVPTRVSTAAEDDAAGIGAAALAGNAPADPAPAGRRLLRLAGLCAGYVAAFVAMGSLIVWAIDRWSGPTAPIVAALPVVVALPEQREIGARMDLEISAFLMGLDRLRVLSPSAIDSRPANPFPFFFYEFGARWVVEAELRAMPEHALLTLTVADARTGIVELQVTERIQGDGLLATEARPRVLTDLGGFFDQRLR